MAPKDVRGLYWAIVFKGLLILLFPWSTITVEAASALCYKWKRPSVNYRITVCMHLFYGPPKGTRQELI